MIRTSFLLSAPAALFYAGGSLVSCYKILSMSILYLLPRVDPERFGKLADGRELAAPAHSLCSKPCTVRTLSPAHSANALRSRNLSILAAFNFSTSIRGFFTCTNGSSRLSAASRYLTGLLTGRRAHISVKTPPRSPRVSWVSHIHGPYPYQVIRGGRSNRSSSFILRGMWEARALSIIFAR